MSYDAMRCALCGSAWVGSHACYVGDVDGARTVPSDAVDTARALARADLELRTKELLRRILQGALDPRGFESLRAQERREKFEDDARALLAERVDLDELERLHKAVFKRGVTVPLSVLWCIDALPGLIAELREARALLERAYDEVDSPDLAREIRAHLSKHTAKEAADAE